MNLWPRPIQQPHPPIWIPGAGTPGTLIDILRRNYAFVFLSWSGPKLVGRQMFDRYWELAEQQGRDRNPYRLAFLQVVAVSETDASAEKEYAPHLEAHYRTGLGTVPASGFAVPGYAEPAGIEHMIRNPASSACSRRCATSPTRRSWTRRWRSSAVRRRSPTRSRSSSGSFGSATCW